METKKQSGTIQGITCPSCGVFSPDALSTDNLLKARYDMYEALKDADKLIKIARQYFPKSIRNSNTFQLENTCATISKAIDKAEGK